MVDYITEALQELNILNEDKSSKKTINSHVTNMLLHMLKCKYQNDYPNKASWRGSIINSFDEFTNEFTAIGIGSLYKKFYIKEVDLNKLYRVARQKASIETGLPINTFPLECEWTKYNLVDIDFIDDFIEEYGQDIDNNLN